MTELDLDALMQQMRRRISEYAILDGAHMRRDVPLNPGRWRSGMANQTLSEKTRIAADAEQYARWNAKYSSFYVTRHSPISGHQIQVGKPHKTIEEALCAARRSDERWPERMHFVDCVRPRAAE